jgi:hypothetical protein
MAFVGASHHDDLHGWLDERIGAVLGPDARLALAETWMRLRYSTRPDAPHVEAGRWRARLEDRLGNDPKLAADLTTLVRETRQRLRARTLFPGADLGYLRPV